MEQIRKNERRIPDARDDYSRQFLHIVKYAEDQEVEDPLNVKLKNVQTQLQALNAKWHHTVERDDSQIHANYVKINELVDRIKEKIDN